MKKFLSVLAAVILTFSTNLYSVEESVPDIYILTCGPGTETYSRWGHSALRIVDYAAGTDRVYNWGVFDFSTPAFAWKFARGRLEYMLGVSTFERFIQEYFMEGRWVQSQKINLESNEVVKLIQLIEENLRPENIKYRYDFFYDDCSTRIRDLLENSIGSVMIYPPEIDDDPPSFRFMVNKYLQKAPWLKAGVDLLMGIRGNKKVSLRDRMFLPVDMKEGLSDIVINRNGKMIPLLSNPDTVLGSTDKGESSKFITSPIVVFSLLLILVILASALIRGRKQNKVFDIIIFSIFSVLALLMIFFNFFTGHKQMEMNPNIIWLSPFIILCLISIMFNRNWFIWFRIVFVLNIIWFVVLLIFPHISNSAFLPVVLILAVRSSARSDYKWNPMSIGEGD